MYFPSISLVWASRPGREPKISPDIGIKINSKGSNIALNFETSLGRGGLCLELIMIITKRGIKQMVRMNDDIFERLKPIAVLEKFLFTQQILSIELDAMH